MRKKSRVARKMKILSLFASIAIIAGTLGVAAYAITTANSHQATYEGTAIIQGNADINVEISIWNVNTGEKLAEKLINKDSTSIDTKIEEVKFDPSKKSVYEFRIKITNPNGADGEAYVPAQVDAIEFNSVADETYANSLFDYFSVSERESGNTLVAVNKSYEKVYRLEGKDYVEGLNYNGVKVSYTIYVSASIAANN